jgi:hypothetical protein
MVEEVGKDILRVDDVAVDLTVVCRVAVESARRLERTGMLTFEQ